MMIIADYEFGVSFPVSFVVYYFAAVVLRCADDSSAGANVAVDYSDSSFAFASACRSVECLHSWCDHS